MSRILCRPGLTLAQYWSTRPPESRAASILLGAFSRREMVDWDASGAPLSGQRPTASFISGSCLSRSRSLPSSRHRRWPSCAPSPARTSRAGCGPDRGDPAWQRQAAGTRRAFVSASRNSRRPASDDWLPPSKSTVSFLRQDGWQVEGKRRIVGHGGCGVALIREAPRVDSDLLRESLVSCHSRLQICHRHA